MMKTRIFGFGQWNGRLNWPYPNIKIESSSINILGITYSQDFDDSVDRSWLNVLSKIKKKMECYLVDALHYFKDRL